MTKLIRTLKPEDGSYNTKYPNIASQIDREIGYTTTSFEALMQSINRGKKPPSIFNHLFDNLQS